MRKVLVVDDYVMCRRAVATILAGEGFQVLEAANGLEALALALHRKPQLIISDIVMPLMDGCELVKRLRAEPSIATTPVIFHTAHHAAEEPGTLVKSCGVQDVLAKPSSLARIRKALRNLT